MTRDIFDYLALGLTGVLLITLGYSIGATTQAKDDAAKLAQVEGAWARALAECEGKR